MTHRGREIEEIIWRNLVFTVPPERERFHKPSKQNYYTKSPWGEDGEVWINTLVAALYRIYIQLNSSVLQLTVYYNHSVPPSSSSPLKHACRAINVTSFGRGEGEATRHRHTFRCTNHVQSHSIISNPRESRPRDMIKHL